MEVESVPADVDGDLAEAITTTRLFLRQQLWRREHLTLTTPSLLSWLFQVLFGPPRRPNHPHSPTEYTHNHTDLGLALDYEPRIFQPINPATVNDIHLLTFDRPVLARSPSKEETSTTHCCDFRPNYPAASPRWVTSPSAR